MALIKQPPNRALGCGTDLNGSSCALHQFQEGGSTPLWPTTIRAERLFCSVASITPLDGPWIPGRGTEQTGRNSDHQSRPGHQACYAEVRRSSWFQQLDPTSRHGFGFTMIGRQFRRRIVHPNAQIRRVHSPGRISFCSAVGVKTASLCRTYGYSRILIGLPADDPLVPSMRLAAFIGGSGCNHLHRMHKLDSVRAVTTGSTMQLCR